MRQDFYDYSRDREGRYRFTSRGKINIIKIVDVTQTSRAGIYNLWFGDLLPDNSIDDMIISNNGDIQKVFATVIQIVREITIEKPGITLVFKGSTEVRMSLYRRILKTYHSELITEFTITAFVLHENSYTEVLFNPHSVIEYLAFFVKRNN